MVWRSPIRPEHVAGSQASVGWVSQVDGEVWWIQSADDGRGYGLHRVGGPISGPGTTIRSRVHEYGGEPYAGLPDGRFCFVEWADQRLYVQAIGGSPQPLSPVPSRAAGCRYAGPVAVGDEVWVLREDFFGDAPTDVTRDFVALPADGGAADDPSAVRVLGAGVEHGGHHFLSKLRLSPDGTRAAWIGWNHPYMSWDRSELVVADVVDGRFADCRVVAGGAPTAETVGDGISICQVEWESDDTLIYLSDSTGWSNLYRHRLGEAAVAIHPVESELGGALWRVGQTWFGIISPGVFAVHQDGRLAILDEVASTITPVTAGDGAGLPLWSAAISVENGRVAGVAFGPKRLPAVATFSGGVVETLSDLPALPDIEGVADLATDWLPAPEFRWFDAADGSRIPANVYRPTHPGESEDGPAPYVVHIHGGPTGNNGTGLDLEIVYFTSRGIGVVVPEYGGSTGFGRRWRERLNGQWGVVDLADAIAVAEELVKEGVADPARLGIRGGSAGGFTTALALTSPSPFVAGCARYPVIDLLAFAGGETHDLESRYLDGIVGPLPESADVYRERSPASRAAQLHAPLLVLQGLDDQICQPRTTQRFVDAVRSAGGDIDYRAYDGEQHGFRAASTVADAIEVELDHFATIFGLTVPGVDP
jgi:dipeptidyl aminopeptidase/acylaminoacyl peptidase